MIDDVKFVVVLNLPKDYHKRVKRSIEYCGVLFDPVFRQGEVIYYKGCLRNLRLVMFDKGIKVSGSLHKFQKGENYSTFAHSELLEAVKELIAIFGNEVLQANLDFWTPAINIRLDAKQFVDSLQMIRTRPCCLMYGGSSHQCYGKYVKRSYDRIKVYNKQFEVLIKERKSITKTLRIEKEINLRRAKTCKSSYELSVEDLTSDSFKELCHNELKDSVVTFVFNQFIPHYDLKSREELVVQSVYSSKYVLHYKQLVDKRTFRRHQAVYDLLQKTRVRRSYKSEILDSLETAFSMI